MCSKNISCTKYSLTNVKNKNRKFCWNGGSMRLSYKRKFLKRLYTWAWVRLGLSRDLGTGESDPSP